MDRTLGTLWARAGAEPSSDTLWGDSDRAITTVAVGWSADVRGLRTAIEAGADAYIARTHPFYAPPQGFDPAIVPPGDAWSDTVADDPVVAAKERLVADAGLVLGFLPALWDTTGTSRSAALAHALGHADAVEIAPGVMIAGAGGASLDDIMDDALARLGAPRALLAGARPAAIRSVAVIAGLASPARLAQALDDPEVDAIITGETVEWEGTPFIQDAVSAGRQVALVALGNAVSEAPATRVLCDALADALPGTGVVGIETVDAAWTPQGLA